MINAIIEVAKDHHSDSKARLIRALGNLRQDLGIKDYHLCHEEPTEIPDFEHNHKCLFENKEPYGVHRYFNLYLEWPDFDRLLGRAIVLNEFVHLIPCEKTL